MLTLGGCGGVEFQGKIFDYAGLSGERKQEDVQMSERAPLVIPPNTNHLPPPGSGPATPASWPTNPEVAAREAEQQRREEEKKTAETQDALNPYAGKPTLLDKLFGRDKEETAEVAAVPEPDPSASIPPVNSRSQGAPQRNAYKPPTEGPTPLTRDEEEEEPKASTYQSVNDGSYRGL
ncbi:hypothetical protein [Methyloligella halotolerans]|uniref:hypothetical protein n=1 Tax=Methyloligella halotolerans TaxID=1177755 RepID=UPI00083E6171|nr:hypothetical protein [Methyloligella halotolerans]